MILSFFKVVILVMVGSFVSVHRVTAGKRKQWRKEFQEKVRVYWLTWQLFRNSRSYPCLVVCLPGKYLDADKNQCQDCPGGTYGVTRGLTNSSCSGHCYAGYFCPPGSSSPTQRQCGSPRVFCPPGSKAPMDVTLGYYTTITTRAEGDGLDEVASKAARTQKEERACERGFYCFWGIRRACPAGTFGRRRKLTTKACSGPCPIGFYCPLSSSEPILCPPGRYGSVEGLTNKDCSGACPMGHYWYVLVVVVYFLFLETGKKNYNVPCAHDETLFFLSLL
jgi:hypothetical protein